MLEELEVVLELDLVPQVDKLLCLSSVSSSPMIPPSARMNCHVSAVQL